MAKLGEIQYMSRIGEEHVRSTVNKPFSEPSCDMHLAEMSAIMSLLPPPPGRLLDLGCGTGWSSAFLAKRGYEVVGTDIAADMIHYANLNKEKEDLDNLSFVESDYEEMSFSNCFDCAVFLHSLHHAMDEALAIQKVYDALRPGGTCVVCEPGTGHADSPAALQAVEQYGVTEKDMPPRKVIALARRAGFRSMRVYPHIVGNRIFDYRPGQEVPLEPIKDPLASADRATRKFHCEVQQRLQIPEETYSTFLAELPRLLELMMRIVNLRQLDLGIVVLTK
jgi:ubiquinone/menaquinone biosynthesis C-methylase UbiE